MGIVIVRKQPKGRKQKSNTRKKEKKSLKDLQEANWGSRKKANFARASENRSKAKKHKRAPKGKY